MRSTTLILALLSSPVLAQEDQAGLPPPPPPPPMVDAPTQPAPAEEGRVRWGLNAQLGAFLPQTAVMFGIEARLGYQLDRLLAVFLNVSGDVGLGLGASGNSSASSASVNLIGYYTAGLLGEVTLGDHFVLALGPALAGGGWAGFVAKTTGAETSTTAVLAGGGSMVAVDFKLGVGLGRRQPQGRRSHFSLGLDVLVLFAPNSLYTTTSSSGTVSAETRGLAVGVAPTLTLGFDAR